MRSLPPKPRRILFLSLFLLLPQVSRAEGTSWIQSAPPQNRYWVASAGGEWDFLNDKGPPLNGKDWQEFHWSLGYVKKQSYSLTFSHRIPARTDTVDQVLGLEGYAKTIGPIWFRGFVAGSPDHDFAYQLRTDAELEAYFPYVSFGAGYWFIKYNTTDIHVVTPFIRFYVRNLQLDFRYMNLLDTTADKRFNLFSVRLANDFDERWIRPFVGMVVGSRLFGVLSFLESPGQRGLLVYGGNKFGITPRLDWSVMVSYARENPAFEYVGLGTDMTLKF